MKYLKLFEEVDAFDYNEYGDEARHRCERPVWSKEFDIEEVKNILYDIKDMGFHIDIQSRHDVKGTWHEIMDENNFIKNYLDKSKLLSSKTKMDNNKPDWVILYKNVKNVLKQKFLEIDTYHRKYKSLDKEKVEDAIFEIFDRLSENYDVFYYIYTKGGDFFSVSFSVYNKTKDTKALLNYRTDINYTGGSNMDKWTLNENVDNTYNTIKDELEHIKYILEDDNIEFNIIDNEEYGEKFDNKKIVAKIILVNKSMNRNFIIADRESFKEFIDRTDVILSSNNCEISYNSYIHFDEHFPHHYNYFMFYIKKI